MAIDAKRQQLDLRGEVCPYTFVRAKLALEELNLDDELELTLDHRPAWSSVPRALREEGHELLHVDAQPKVAETFRILVRKRPPPKPRERI